MTAGSRASVPTGEDVTVYVRTGSGVAQLGPGEKVPDDADPVDVARLIAAGALVDPFEDESVKTILGRVGEDKEAAATALASELAKPDPRSSLVTKLQGLVDAQPDEQG